MDDVCSLACPAMAGTASVAAMRDVSRSLLRWVVVGAASTVLFVLAVMQSTSVGAAAPTAYDNTVCINYTTCYPTTTPTTATTGYPPNTVIVAPYFDNRYGVVEVVTDGSGNLIDINPYTGQRIFPFLPDFVGGIGANFIGANVVGGAFLPPGVTNGITCNGVYGCPFGGGFIGNTNVNFVNGNNCAFFANCAAVFPAGGTVVGGVVYYNDNRFCTDGKIAFVPGRGYFCQNGGPLVTNNNATTVNCGNFFFDGCGVFRPFEANTTAPAAPKQATTVTAYSAPAAPQAAAPAATAPTANVATALNAPATPQVAPITAKAQTTSAPSVAGKSAGAEKSDDHKG